MVKNKKNNKKNSLNSRSPVIDQRARFTGRRFSEQKLHEHTTQPLIEGLDLHESRVFDTFGKMTFSAVHFTASTTW